MKKNFSLVIKKKKISNTNFFLTAHSPVAKPSTVFFQKKKKQNLVQFTNLRILQFYGV